MFAVSALNLAQLLTLQTYVNRSTFGKPEDSTKPKELKFIHKILLKVEFPNSSDNFLLNDW